MIDKEKVKNVVDFLRFNQALEYANTVESLMRHIRKLEVENRAVRGTFSRMLKVNQLGAPPCQVPQDAHFLKKNLRKPNKPAKPIKERIT